MQDAIIKLIANMYFKIFANVNSLGEIMAGLFDSSGEGLGAVSAAENAATKITQNIAGAMSGVGLAISLLFFIIALLELSTTERLTLEYFIKFFSKLAIAVALIIACPKLIENIGLFASALAQEFAVEGKIPKEVSEDTFIKFMQNEAGGLKWISILISGILTAGIMNLVSLVLLVLTWVVAFSRVLEMSIRGCFLPIAIGMMSDDGWRGAGGRYIRKYIAICCQSSVIVLVGRLTLNVTRAVMMFALEDKGAGAGTSVMGATIMVLGVAIAAVSLLFKSIGIVNDAFGG